MNLPLIIRDATQDDLPLILNSWLKSYRNAPAVTTVPNDIYYHETMGQKARILELLQESRTQVACSQEDPDIAYGWITAENEAMNAPPIVHYCYVKQPYRRQGVCRALLKAAGVAGTPPWCTHETPGAKRTGISYTFNPFYLSYEIEYMDASEDIN